MKIKVDFVTNSSSEVFGVVINNAAAVSGIFGALMIILNGCKDGSDESSNSGSESSNNDIINDTEKMAKEIANAVSQEASEYEEIVKDAYNEAEKTLDSAKTALEKELEECQKIWIESEKTADKSCEGYEEYKKQYEEYMKYLNAQVEQVDYQKQMVEYEKVQKQAEMESKSQWIKEKQTDYIAVKEEKALLQAVAKGYDVPGYNSDDVKIRIKQLEEREKELDKTLKENDATIDYTAKDRGEIAPSKESIELNNKIREEKARFERETKEADAKKRASLEEKMKKNIAEYEASIASARRWDLATKAAEGIQFGSDVAIEGLSYVTGPAGQKVKLAYKAGKNVASGLGEGIADPKNASKHLAKGILNAGAEVVKDKFGSDKPWQAAATGILNEGLQSGLDASIKGEDVLDAMGKGLTKGVVDAGVDRGLDIIKDKLPIPKGSSVDVGDFTVTQTLKNNPLTKGLAKTMTREVVGSQLKDNIKSGIVDKIGENSGFVDPK